MPDIIRNFVKDGFYHIYNRGNHRDTVFFDSFDYGYFLSLISENADKYQVEILAYCLMHNHFHFLVRQKADNHASISKWIGCTTMSYSHYFNNKYKQVGSVFQGRFRSKPVQTDEYLLHLSKYIHNNPMEFTDPKKYQWSSMRSYLYNRKMVADPAYILNYLKGTKYELEAYLEVALV